jgi:hypothetical protein
VKRIELASILQFMRGLRNKIVAQTPIGQQQMGRDVWAFDFRAAQLVRFFKRVANE